MEYKEKDKRYLLSEDPIIKNNLQKLQIKIKELQIQYPEFV
jgi:hypothetical protein